MSRLPPHPGRYALETGEDLLELAADIGRQRPADDPLRRYTWVACNPSDYPPDD